MLVAGFQGVSAVSHDVTTLGRGGSDTTAVALAAALGASACEIYTDVEGVFTADPRLVPGARKLGAVTYEEMLELAGERGEGAPATLGRVRTQPRRAAARPLHVLARGGERGSSTRRIRCWRKRSSAASRTPTASRSTASARSTPRSCSRGSPSASVNVDTILQVASDEIVFSAPLEDRAVCEELLGRLDVEWSMRDDLGKVSLVGAGMKSHPGIAAKTFATLEGIGVESKVISTSPIKIACHVRTEDVPRAVSALHDAFAPGDGMRTDARIGVIGATGAVGAVTMRLLARARPRERARVRVGPLGRAHARRRHRRRGGDRPRRSPRPASTSRSSPSAPRPRASSSPTPSTAARSSSTSRAPTGSSTATRSSCPR